ncbi:MAG: hypothetical protein K8R74_03910 [Bacteroidales bacterium]|nr:hypothetical protein [Bacteroidales bacterium]
MKIKFYFFLVFLLIILLSGCRKERYSGQYPLSDELKFLLPIDSICQYNNDSIINLMTLSFTDNYYFNDTWDTDDGGLTGIIYYTGDFETKIKHYTSDLFNINYKIFVDKHMDVQRDVLDISLENNISKENIDIHIEMPLKDYQDRGYEPNIDFADSVIVNDVKLFDIYFTESNGLLYYFQKDKGLIAFEFNNSFWKLTD